MQSRRLSGYAGGVLETQTLWLPNGARDAQGLRCIVLGHGRSATDAQPALTNWLQTLQPVIDRTKRYAAISGQHTRPNPWGDDPQWIAMRNLKQYAQAALPTGLGMASGRAAYWGWSMGGLGALNAGGGFPSEVAGIVLFASVIDLAYFRNIGTYTTEVDFNYGADTLNFRHATIGGTTTLNQTPQTLNVDGDTTLMLAGTSQAAIKNQSGVFIEFQYTGKTDNGDGTGTLTGCTIASGTANILDGTLIVQCSVTTPNVAITATSVVDITVLGNNGNYPAVGTGGKLIVQVSDDPAAPRYELIDYATKATTRKFTTCKRVGGANFTTAAEMQCGRTDRFTTTGPRHDPADYDQAGAPTLAQLRALKVLAFQAPVSGGNADTVVGGQTTGIDDLTTAVNAGQNPTPWSYTEVTDAPAGEGHSTFMYAVDPDDIIDFLDAQTWT